MCFDVFLSVLIFTDVSKKNCGYLTLCKNKTNKNFKKRRTRRRRRTKRRKEHTVIHDCESFSVALN